MKRPNLPLLLAAALSLSSQSGRADDDPVMVAGEVRVSAQRQGGVLLPNSVMGPVDLLGADRVGDNRVGDKNVDNSWVLLGQLPVIPLTETRMGAQSGKATFRAFNGEGTINGITFKLKP